MMANTDKTSTRQHDCQLSGACNDCGDACCASTEHTSQVERTAVKCLCGALVCVNCEDSHPDDCALWDCEKCGAVLPKVESEAYFVELRQTKHGGPTDEIPVNRYGALCESCHAVIDHMIEIWVCH